MSKSKLSPLERKRRRKRLFELLLILAVAGTIIGVVVAEAPKEKKIKYVPRKKNNEKPTQVSIQGLAKIKELIKSLKND